MEIQNFLKFNELDYKNSPFLLKQYIDIKLKYPDFIVFFRVGSFYETYFEDAITLSKITGITLTRKTFKIGTVLMAGFVHNKINSYIEKLIKNNYKIAIVDETDETTKDNKIIRKVTKTYTKGNIFEYEFLNPKENNYLLSIYKENDLYKIAYTDISVGEIFTSEGCIDEIECELSRINPVEVIIPDNSDIKPSLFEAVKFEKLRKEFYEGNNENKAVNALINYLKYTLQECMPSCDKIREYDIKNTLLMDYYTRKNLEITKNTYNNNIEGSLLWAIDNCKTSMGKRLLSSLISSPLYNLDEIKKRQNSISKLLQNKNLIPELENILSCIGDISRLTSKMSNKTITPLEFITLKEGLSNLDKLIKIQKKLNLSWKLKKEENCKILEDYYYILDKTFEDDIEKVKFGDFIKKGASPELDLLYENKEKLLSELDFYEDYLKKETKIDSLKIERKSGNYFIEINSNCQNEVSPDFAIIQRLKNTTRYKTKKLFELGEKILSNEAKIQETKGFILNNLRKYSTAITPYVRSYSKEIAILDVINSNAITCLEYNLAAPDFIENEFQIEGLKHITAEKILKGFKPLNINLSDSNFVFLTGINGSGKSTLLKAIGSLIILSQAGFYVPSTNCKIPLMNKLCAILNVSDELINKKSTHQRQMQSVSYALKNLDDKSLLLMDEIGKNTSYKDGISLSAGIIKYLASQNIRTIFSTHLIEIKDYIKDSEDKISFCKIEDIENRKEFRKGITEKSFGIEIAKEENLPDDVISYAKGIKSIL